MAAATLLLDWLAVTRLVAPVGRIVHGLENLDAAGTRPPLPRFTATEFDRIARACNALADRLAHTEAERAGLMQRLVTVSRKRAAGPCARPATMPSASALPLREHGPQRIRLAAPPERDDLREDARGIEAIIAPCGRAYGGALARLELPDLAEAGLEEALRGPRCGLVWTT